MFGGIYKGKKVLVTGHTGFKGSWLALWLKKLGAQVAGYSISEVSTPSHFGLLDLDINSRFGDIRDKENVNQFFSEVKPEIVFHLAAQSLVRESYRDPSFTYETNVIGTLNVLEAARKTGSVYAIVNITTDKVYENLEHHVAYKEEDPLGGHDMYSSSKACSEILTASFRNSFLSDHSILLASARAGNVIGGGDWAKERLIPDLITGAVSGNGSDIRSPFSVRPWEHVLEPLSGYLLLGQQLLSGKKEIAAAWNFGPEPEMTLKVEEVVTMMRENWSKIDFKINRELANQFHEAALLKLDCSKAKEKLLWETVWTMDRTIEKTVNWYQKYYENNEIISAQDIDKYVEDARDKSLKWSLQ